MMARSSSKQRHPCPNRPPRGIARSKKVHVWRLVISACKRESRSRKGELDARVRGRRRGRRSSPFGSRKRLCEIERNENAVKPLKINNVSEISDSAIVMISMGYDLRCETFVSLSERFVSFFAGFGLVDARNEMGRGVVARHHSECRRLGSCGRKKLRKRAAKPMKSLARVNLCAGSTVVVSCADARPNKRVPGTASETAASAG